MLNYSGRILLETIVAGALISSGVLLVASEISNHNDLLSKARAKYKSYSEELFSPKKYLCNSQILPNNNSVIRCIDSNSTKNSVILFAD